MAFNKMINFVGSFFMPKVKDLMTQTLSTLETTATLKEALLAAAQDNIRSLVILEKGKPVGILTRRDLINLCFLQKLDPEQTTVGSVMSQPLITLDSNENIFKAYELMTQKNFTNLIILEQNKPVGRIRLDEIRHIAAQTPGTNLYRAGYFLLGVLITLAVTLIIVTR